MKSKITVKYKNNDKEEAIARLNKMINMIKDCDALTKIDINFTLVEGSKKN